MIVGCLGDISFAVFDSHVETIKNMVQNVSARYTTHQRAGGPALTEFTGTDAQTITFDIELAAYLGVNPTKERERLQECVLNGTTLPFVLGNVVYGSYRWVICKIQDPAHRRFRYTDMDYRKRFFVGISERMR